MITAFYGKKRDDTLQEMLLDLKRNYKQDEHYVFLVPDRFSVLCEKKIFEVLQIESTLNIDVLTLSRLASKVLKNVRVISKSASSMIMQKAILENKSNLKCFKKNLDSTLSISLFGTISQFKSCKIQPEEMAVTNKSAVLRDKLSDMALLYSSYENLLHKKGLLDSMDRLNMLVAELSKNKFITTSHFYVAMFDGFTMQGYEIIHALMKYCKNFSIGLCRTDNPLNEHIYDEKIVDNILKLADGKEVKSVICHEYSSEIQKYMTAHLFSLSPPTTEMIDDSLTLFEGEDFDEEVTFACSKIKSLIKSGKYSSKDFLIAVPHLSDKKNAIKRIFNDFSINFFIDLSENFSNTSVFLLVKSWLEMIKEGYSITSISSFIYNPLCGWDRGVLEDFDDYVRKYKIDSLSQCNSFEVAESEHFTSFKIIRDQLNVLRCGACKMIENAKKCQDFVSGIKQFMQDIDLQNILNNMVQHFTSCGEQRNASLFGEYYDKIISLLDGLNEILSDEEMSLKDFITTLENGALDTKVSTVPLSTDAVFIGDSSSSFFERRKVCFILSAINDEFPASQSDVGLITDKDIQNVSEKYRLEPSIKEINRKERFKAFELLLKPSEKLFLSYNYNKGAQKSKIVEEVGKMFTNHGTAINPLKFSDLPLSTRNSSLPLAKHNFTRLLRSTLDRERSQTGQDAMLYNAVKNKLDNNFFDNFYYKNVKKIEKSPFFCKKTTSISEIEEYMTCPFRHFIDRGLRIKERENGEIDNRHIGSFLHSCAEVFFKHFSVTVDDSDIDIVSQKVFDMVLSKDQYKYVFTTPIDMVLKNNLLLELKRFITALNYQARHSKFVPKYFEYRYDDSGSVKGLKIKTKNGFISLVGVIDRIDVFGDHFRVIDYKTGSVDCKLDELFFGKKIQLEAYIKVVSSSTKLKPAGSYYLHISDSAVDDEKDVYKKYQLQGRTLNNLDVIYASDSSLCQGNNKSDIVQISINKDGSYSKNSVLGSESQFFSLSNYAYALISRAVSDILELNITPSPMLVGGQDPCQNCKYHLLCRFDTAFGNRKRLVNKKISIEDFDGEGTNEAN